MTTASLSRVRSSVPAMIAASIAFAVLMGFAALVRIPLAGTPVPLTLQTLVLFAGAGLLRRHYAMLMVACYLLLGICGAPFFTGGSGWHYLFGATGGYLIGFMVAAAILGYGPSAAHRRGRSLARYAAAVLAIYIPGVAQLMAITGWSWEMSLARGVLPFIAFDALKAVAAWYLIRQSGTTLPLDRKI